MKKLMGGNPGQVSLIAENCKIEGDLIIKSQLIVNGVVEGNICALDDQDAIITVGQRGLVKGEIRAPTIIVNGKVEGDIKFDINKPDGNMRKLIDTSRLRRMGWIYSTELENGLRKTYDWYVKTIEQSKLISSEKIFN